MLLKFALHLLQYGGRRRSNKVPCVCHPLGLIFAHSCSCVSGVPVAPCVWGVERVRARHAIDIRSSKFHHNKQASCWVGKPCCKMRRLDTHGCTKCVRPRVQNRFSIAPGRWIHVDPRWDHTRLHLQVGSPTMLTTDCLKQQNVCMYAYS